MSESICWERVDRNPSLRGNSHDMPPLPMEYEEKEVLREFIVRTNTIISGLGESICLGRQKYQPEGQ